MGLWHAPALIVGPGKVSMPLLYRPLSKTPNIDTYIIKLVAQDILAPLTHIINISMAKSTFPSLWKHAKVVHLLKKGDPLIAKNYRPVALVPIFSKILERVVFNQLVGYLDSNSLIHPTTMALDQVIVLQQLSYRCMTPG